MGERHGDGALILWLGGLEGVGADHDRDGARLGALGTQLFCGAADVVGDRLAQLDQVEHGAAERAAGHDLLFGRCDGFERQAGSAVELTHGALQDDAEMLPDPLRVCRAQAFDRFDAQFAQSGGDATAHAPHFVDCGFAEKLLAGGFVQARQVAHAVEGRALFGEVVGELGERFGRGDTDAHRQAHPARNTLTDLLTVGGQVQVREAAQVQEGFVDAVDLELGREAAQDFDDPIAHVGIQRVVRGQRDDAMLLRLFGDLEPGHAHRDAERLRFGRARDHAAVVVGEYYHRPAGQLRREELFARGVEVVAVDEGDGLCRCVHVGGLF